MKNQDVRLIEAAQAVWGGFKLREDGDFSAGTVGAAIQTVDGNTRVSASTWPAVSDSVPKRPQSQKCLNNEKHILQLLSQLEEMVFLARLAAVAAK